MRPPVGAHLDLVLGEGPLQLGDLKPGQSRPLTQTELERLFEEIQK